MLRQGDEQANVAVYVEVDPAAEWIILNMLPEFARVLQRSWTRWTAVVPKSAGAPAAR